MVQATFTPSKHAFEFHPEGSFFTWICYVGVWVYDILRPQATRIELISTTDEFGEDLPDDIVNAYLAEIAQEAERLVDTWYDAFIRETACQEKQAKRDELPESFQDYAEFLADRRDSGEDPAHYATRDSVPVATKDDLPVLPGVPRSVRVDAGVPCTPGTAGFEYL